MATSFPQSHPLRHAYEELGAADVAYRKIVGVAQPFDEYESAWREVLRRLERVWTKTQAAVHHLPGWKKIEAEVAHLRRSDPLLRYIGQARNVDEHSIQNLAKEYEWNFTATPQPEGILFRWSPWDRPLLPVVNRGVTYAPPRVHLGQSIEPLLGKGKAEPRVVAELAIEFYVKFMNQVSLELVGTNYDASQEAPSK